MNKRVIISTLAATLAMAPIITITPLVAPVAHAAEGGDAVSQLTSRITRIHNMLEPNELIAVSSALDTVRTQLASNTKDQIKQLLSNTTYSQVTDDQKQAVIQFVEGLAMIYYSNDPVQLNQTLNDVKSNVADLKVKFNVPGLTTDEVYNFALALEDAVQNNISIADLASFSNFQSSISTKTKQAMEGLLGPNTQYPNIKSVLEQVFGTDYINDLAIVKHNVQAEADANGLAEKALVQATIRTMVNVYSNNSLQNSLTVTQGKSIDFSLKVKDLPILGLGSLISGEVVDNSNNVVSGISVSINGTAATATLNAASSVSASSNYTIRMYYNGSSKKYLITKIPLTVNASTTTGGGGGGGGVVTQPPIGPVDTTVTETTGTNANGQTTITATVDESQILNAVGTSGAPVNVVLTVKGNADVITAPISVSTINALNAKNTKNTLTLQTPNGNFTIPVSELVQAVADSHVDANAKVNLIVEKASSADQQALANALGVNTQRIAGLTIMKVAVTSGDQSYELHTYKGYVKNVIVLDGQYDVNQLVGVQYLGALHPAAKSETVKSASVSATGNVFAPVPTTVEFKDGKTIVTLNNKTSNPITVVKTTKAFTDVTDQWFAKDVTTLANKLLITGRTTTNFVPQGILTRAEFATMIARSLGLTEATNGKNFSDVQAGDWFAGYVGAASKAGLVSGNTDGSFKPNAPVSREEAATIIMNAVKYTGGNVTLTDKEKADALAQFKDAGHASSWATDALAFAAKSNILKGSNGSINPKDKSTRAESAALLIRFLESINFISE